VVVFNVKFFYQIFFVRGLKPLANLAVAKRFLETFKVVISYNLLLE
jgi:hypothetical protein